MARAAKPWSHWNLYHGQSRGPLPDRPAVAAAAVVAAAAAADVAAEVAGAAALLLLPLEGGGVCCVPLDERFLPFRPTGFRFSFFCGAVNKAFINHYIHYHSIIISRLVAAASHVMRDALISMSITFMYVRVIQTPRLIPKVLIYAGNPTAQSLRFSGPLRHLFSRF